jgi:predicted phage tail protein
MAPNAATGFDVTVAPTGGFSGTVSLTASSSSASVGVTPPSTSAASPYAPVHFTASSTAAGSYTVTITGVAGSLTRTTTVSVTVGARPAAPVLSATAGNASVALTWTAPADGGAPITGYALYRGTAAGAESLVATLGSVTSYTDAGLKNGTTYYYRVSAVNGVGEGPLSNERSARPAARPCLVLCR